MARQSPSLSHARDNIGDGLFIGISSIISPCLSVICTIPENKPKEIRGDQGRGGRGKDEEIIWLEIPFFPADARKCPSGCQENVTFPVSCLSEPTLKRRFIFWFDFTGFRNSVRRDSLLFRAEDLCVYIYKVYFYLSIPKLLKDNSSLALLKSVSA